MGDNSYNMGCLGQISLFVPIGGLRQSAAELLGEACQKQNRIHRRLGEAERRV